MRFGEYSTVDIAKLMQNSVLRGNTNTVNYNGINAINTNVKVHDITMQTQFRGKGFMFINNIAYYVGSDIEQALSAVIDCATKQARPATTMHTTEQLSHSLASSGYGSASGSGASSPLARDGIPTDVSFE